MAWLIGSVLLLLGLGAGALLVFSTEGGKEFWDSLFGGKKRNDLTDLQAADSLSTADEVGAQKQGVARNPHSVVLGYHIDASNAGRVKRNPERGLLVSTEPYLPTLCFGPPGSGKTSGLLIPAVLTFGLGQGPVLCGSVKHDLAIATIKLRSKLGEAVILDPTGQTPPSLRKYLALWTPLASCRTWKGSVETAGAIVFASGSDAGADNSFWTTQSISLLSVMMYTVASRPGTSMRDISKLLGELLETAGEKDGDEDNPAPKGLDWIREELHQLRTTHTTMRNKAKDDAASGAISAGEATEILNAAERKLDELEAAEESLAPFFSIARTAPATIGSILASVSNVLAVYRFARDFAKVAWDDPRLVDIDKFITGGANTVYLTAPPRDQQLYAPLLSAFLTAAISRAYELGQQHPDGALPQGLLLAIDELAAMPLADVPSLLATARSYRVTPLIATQDASQLVIKYGREGMQSIVSSSASVVVLPRTKDVETLRVMSTIAGEVRVMDKSKTTSTSKSKGGESSQKQTGESESVTESWSYRPLLPEGKIASFAKNEGFAIIGSNRCQILLRPYYQTPILNRLSEGDTSAIAEENAFKNVTAELPSRPQGKLVDLESVPDEPEVATRRRRNRQPQVRELDI